MPRAPKWSPPPGAPATLGELFHEACARFAPRPGVVTDTADSSYGELRERVAGRAAEWEERGVRPGARVAFLGDNTPAFLELYFAAAWAGAVLVPLNHRLHVRELGAILDDAEPALLLWEPAFDDLGRELAPRIPHAGRVAPVEAARSPAEEPAPAAPDDLAHLYYTSGTTGRSKGVQLTHRNVVTHALATVAELGLDGADRWGHFAPMFHLADAWASFAITAVGGAHVLPGRFDAERALACIERHRVTRTNLVPTMLAAMLASPRAASFDPASLRMVLSGGAPIAPALVERVIETFACTYVQTYGMTETSPFLTLGLLDDELAALPHDERLALVARTGRPFAAVELEVVDDAGRPVPADDATVGEIRARGPTVSPGYWRRPEETAAAFRDGWLQTGDLAVVDGRGYLNIVDRKKDVILTGGETVYSTEVEAALFAHPGVLEAAVVGLPDERWGDRVHAVVALRSGASATADELVAFCRERIAAYKTPRSVEFRASLPKTGSGKVEKHRLRTRTSDSADP